METTMASLPPETWLEIAHFVKSYSLENLADLSLASSRLMSIARPVFVRTLTLDATEEEEYEIVDTPILVDTASLRNMSQLKRLRILGRVFIRADEDLKEGYIEALCGLQLEELSFPWPYCFYPFSEDQFKRITDLKSIECYSEVDYHEDFAPRCLRLLSGSVSTLTSLSISAMYIDPDLAMQFLDLRFPLLRSLTFGTWSEEMHSLEGFHHFLLAHNQTLEHLEMGYTSRREVNPTAFLFDGDDDLPRCCLPNLRVFKGHCRNVKTVANASMRASLTKLTIGVSRVEEPKAEINLMLDEIQSERLMGCMGGLKELDFDFFAAEEDELEWIPAFIQKWGADLWAVS
ncbi:WD-REPEATS-REGION domain-containing protein [Mycena venus]|uniref:WD-REPEATS-REGION domain-containing protein n=1 Tax=Mycena venus TaxID=2733690 RepID=A0A8H6YIR3_9AGAR|nr:WD-REPEATS-REGION domain-containing protein [Mycena venus]